jgi:DNA polymerase-1
MSKDRIIIIDGSALFYRAFYAVRELRNSRGQPTNAVFGFVNILRKIMNDFSPQYMAVCLDAGKDTRRKEKYAEYKSHRPSMPEALLAQVPVIREVIQAYGIPVFEMPSFEADDVMATLADHLSGLGHEVVIVTDDKDMFQMVNERIRILSSRKDVLMGVREAQERLGFPPARIVDFIALAGDQSDNIPGVEGVGEVTARKLLSEFGSLENIYRNLDAVSRKLRDRLVAGRGSAELSHELATLDRKVPLDCSLAEIRLKARDNARLYAIFHDLEFRKLASEVETLSVMDQAKETSDPHTGPLKVSDDIKDLVRESTLAGQVSFEVLCEEKDGGKVPMEMYAAAGSKVYCFPFSSVPDLAPLFADPLVAKIVFDLKELHKICSNAALELKGDLFDCHLAGYILRSGRGSLALDALAWSYLNESLSGGEVSARSVSALLRLKPHLFKELEQQDLMPLYQDIELPLARILAQMEIEGVRVDKEFLSRLSAEYELLLADMVRKIHLIAAEEFNVNSPRQLGVVLFEKLKLPVVKRTKTGYSTDEEVLHKLAVNHELPSLVLEYRSLAKLKSTYVDALYGLADPVSGRIHCSFNQTGAETGRLSSNHPNLQNIPIRTEAGRKIRKAFLASAEGRLLLSADYSQIELRVLAHLADEKNLIRAFKAGEDIHKFTAGLIFDVGEDEVTAEMRYRAKRINFGIIYGMSAFGLARDLGISQKEAQHFIDLYFLRYPGIQDFMRHSVQQARDHGFVRTILSRRRYIPEINSKNPAVRQFAERQAVNTPVQGAAADLIKLAMVNIGHEFIRLGLHESRMIITVHDELVFDVPASQLMRTALAVKNVMEGAARLAVPVLVTLKSGRNWAEMEDVVL